MSQKSTECEIYSQNTKWWEVSQNWSKQEAKHCSDCEIHKLIDCIWCGEEFPEALKEFIIVLETIYKKSDIAIPFRPSHTFITFLCLAFYAIFLALSPSFTVRHNVQPFSTACSILWYMKFCPKCYRQSLLQACRHILSLVNTVTFCKMLVVYSIPLFGTFTIWYV